MALTSADPVSPRQAFRRTWDCTYGTGAPDADPARAVFNWDDAAEEPNPDPATAAERPTVKKFGQYVVDGSGDLAPMMSVDFRVRASTTTLWLVTT